MTKPKNSTTPSPSAGKVLVNRRSGGGHVVHAGTDENGALIYVDQLSGERFSVEKGKTLTQKDIDGEGADA